MCIAVFAGIKNSNPAASRKRIGQEKVHGFPRNQRRGQSRGEEGRGERGEVRMGKRGEEGGRE